MDVIKKYKLIIKETINSIKHKKLMGIITSSMYNTSVLLFSKIYDNLNELIKKSNNEDIKEELNNIKQELYLLICKYGTSNIHHIISLCLINDNELIKNIDRYEIINENVEPYEIRVIYWNKNQINHKLIDIKKLDDINLIDNSETLDCFDISRTTNNFEKRVNGIKLVLHDKKESRSYVVYCIIKDIILNELSDTFMNNKLITIKRNKPKEIDDKDDDLFNNYIETLSLKDYLIYNEEEIYYNYFIIKNEFYRLKELPLSELVDEYNLKDLFNKRSMLITLLLRIDDKESQYLAYLLYDLLTDVNNNNIDSKEQNLIMNSLSCKQRKLFKVAMLNTIEHKDNLKNYSRKEIPLEQQIFLLKANDNVKDKAMSKLKEIRSKTDDNSVKARQYLDGLLRIPFSIYKEEYILTIMSKSKELFKKTINIGSNNDKLKELIKDVSIKNKYTNIDVRKNIILLKDRIENNELLQSIILNECSNMNRKEIINIVKYLNEKIKRKQLELKKINYSKKTIKEINNDVNELLIEIGSTEKIKDIMSEYNKNDIINLINIISKNVNLIFSNLEQIVSSIDEINSILDKSVYGHNKAKKQLEIIIGQWMNGDNSGYCIGFEGPPGVGKTSLAKYGISVCLKDKNQEERPFSLIAIGGSSNGSVLDGHNYTYVGSSWGRIVDILIEKKCMNPIIFIDELDKISQTENGKELIGILTHLVDTTQNDKFQDKYFNGIDIDLSKVLFIFSYNDYKLIDSILLDRIHRIKFDSLTLKEKIVITKKYLLPKIYKKMDMCDDIEFEDKVIDRLIVEYTCEPGVRKLKELLFNIIGEINMLIIRNEINIKEKIMISYNDIKYKYLKNMSKINDKHIYNESKIGVINGLWANSLGKGGILHIESSFYPSKSYFELKLTGMQGTIMKESMEVSKTLALSLIDDEIKNIIKDKGIHIHVPDGATNKDGPSAGCAITISIYSLLTNKKIKNDYAITGEIDLNGNITAIGGLELKIQGGIRAGVKNFIFPLENEDEFNDFLEKNDYVLEDINFIKVSNIKEVMNIIFV